MTDKEPTIGAPTVRDLFNALQAQARKEGIDGGNATQVWATALEQDIWLRKLRSGALPKATHPPQLHAALIRSSVAAPEPAGSVAQNVPVEGRGRQARVPRQCGACGNAHARKRCARCEGVVYCDKVGRF